jgi:hypothetical protein
MTQIKPLLASTGMVLLPLTILAPATTVPASAQESQLPILTPGGGGDHGGSSSGSADSGGGSAESGSAGGSAEGGGSTGGSADSGGSSSDSGGGGAESGQN